MGAGVVDGKLEVNGCPGRRLYLDDFKGLAPTPGRKYWQTAWNEMKGASLSRRLPG